MRNMNRTVSVIITICFLLNTVILDLSLAQTINFEPNVDKLATPSQLTDIVGIQHKDMGRIKIALEEQLIALVRPGLPVNLGTFQTILKERSVKERTIYQPADMQFFFHETQPTNAGLCIKVRLKDKYGIRTYYAAFSLQKDKDGGLPITVYTEEQYKGTAGFTKNVPPTKVEDAKTIERYVQHEKGIDAVIRYAHEQGLAKEPISTRFDYRKFVERALKESGIKVTNPEGLIPIEDREFFLVKLTKEIQNMISANPAIIHDEHGKEHKVLYYAHSSNSAIHVFVYEKAFDVLTNTGYVITDPGRNAAYQWALGKVKDNLDYEIGVPLGFRIAVDESGKLWNALNRRLAASDDERIEFQADPFETAIFNLDHVKDRDYAAGAVQIEEALKTDLEEARLEAIHKILKSHLKRAMLYGANRDTDVVLNINGLVHSKFSPSTPEFIVMKEVSEFILNYADLGCHISVKDSGASINVTAVPLMTRETSTVGLQTIQDLLKLHLDKYGYEHSVGIALNINGLVHSKSGPYEPESKVISRFSEIILNYARLGCNISIEDSEGDGSIGFINVIAQNPASAEKARDYMAGEKISTIDYKGISMSVHDNSYYFVLDGGKYSVGFTVSLGKASAFKEKRDEFLESIIAHVRKLIHELPKGHLQDGVHFSADITKGDFAIRGVVSLNDGQYNKSEKPVKSSHTRPGKSPEDALKLIALSEDLRKLLATQGYFILSDYLNAYAKECNRLGFEKLAANPESTARRDLYSEKNSLVAQGMLVTEESNGVIIFKLTGQGQERIKAIMKANLVIALQQAASTGQIQIFAQGFSSNIGAYTGQMNIPHLQEIWVGSSLVGHSETRWRKVMVYDQGKVKNTYIQQGDTDEAINKKLKLASQENFKTILCVGEPREIRDRSKHIDFVLNQIRKDLTGLSEDAILNTVRAIAYEPIWAINTGLNATPADAQAMCKAIRDYLRKTYSGNLATKMRILYGGSVKKENAKELFSQPDLDGFLIGGASLKVEVFVDNIAKTVNEIGPKEDRTPIVAANWKAEPKAKRDSLEAFNARVAQGDLKQVEIVMALPSTLLDRAKSIFKANAVTQVPLSSVTEEAGKPVPAPAQEKRIYFFGADQTEGDGSMKESLGGKGAGLAKMAKLDLPVPPGFTITTNETRAYLKNGKMPDGLEEEIDTYLARLETVRGKKLGDKKDPLLVSVRSGAAASMPGMMDTVLNLGLNDQTVEGLAIRTNNRRFAYDSYRRFIDMFGSIVLGIPKIRFTSVMDARKREKGFKEDTQLDENDMKGLVGAYKNIVKEVTGKEFPQDPRAQLHLAVEAVFKSSNTERAIIYRRINRIPQDTVSAVNIVSMVFGNTGENSGTGVAFSRDTSTGERRFNGEFLINAQGEDVVAGLRKGMPIEQLKDRMPDVYGQLAEISARLENIDKDVQDVEFTIEDGKLWMLQQRRAKRTALAMLKTAVEMVDGGLISKEEAILRVEGQRFEELMHPMVDPEAAKTFTKLAKGTAASPGAAVGKAVFSSKDAQVWANRGEKVILVRKETSPEDLGGMVASQGILTSLGGMTSHAALVARAQGIPAVVGVGDLSINYETKLFIAGGRVINEGDWITVDGTTGNVYEGHVPTIASEIGQVENGTLKAEDSKVYQMYQRLLQWADEIRKTEVWANADTPKEAKRARSLGAQGIGLARTEHMFRVEERRLAVQTMFLAKEGSSERNEILKEIEEMQRRDFEGILEAMEGLPVTIRLLDPPIHEFLPDPDDDKTVNIIAERLHITPDGIRQRIRSTHEINPMLGTRGVRVQILHPSTLKMQTRAMVQAYANLVKRGIHAKLKIMVPNVALVEEFVEVKPVIQGIIKGILDREGISGDDRKIEIGTMIEMPSAALAAEEIAREADFFSFGTNDLTQFTFAASRDDAARSFLPVYISKGIFKYDPTQILHPKVLRLVQTAVQEGRKAKPDLNIGVCGEHGGEPNSVINFVHAELNYVSASPLRIPVARLASAQAALTKKTAMTLASTVPAPIVASTKASKSPAAPAIAPQTSPTLQQAQEQYASATEALNTALERAAEEDINAAIGIASQAGLQIPTHPDEHYNLLVTSEFFANGDLEEHRAKYGDRFDLDSVSGASSLQFISNVLAKAAGKETKTIALVPNDLSAEDLEMLTKAGIRFVRVNTLDLQRAKADKDANRGAFQVDTYAMMLLLRRVDNSITADSSLYGLLRFYLRSHFALTDKIAVDDYIMAIVNNDVTRLIKGYLAYRPAKPYDKPDYNTVAASLISA